MKAAMREITDNERVVLIGEICEVFYKSVSDDYASYILDHVKNGNTFLEDVVNDISETSLCEEYDYWNEDDIRLAIGRVLMNRLGIDI